MPVRAYVVVLLVCAALGAGALVTLSLLLLQESQRLVRSSGESSLEYQAVEEFALSSTYLLTVLDLLNLEQSNAFVLAEAIHQDCQAELTTLLASKSFAHQAELHRVVTTLDHMVEEGGLASITADDHPEKGAVLTRFDALADSFLAARDALERAARVTVQEEKRYLASFKRSTFIAIAASSGLYLLSILGLALWAQRKLSRPLARLETQASLAMKTNSELALSPDGPLEVQSLTSVITTFINSLETRVLDRTVQLESEVIARRAAEEALREANDQLELRVEERTRDLTSSLERLETEEQGRKRAEAERKDMEGQLLQSQKMEAIGHLAGGVAHDFNNLLMVIHGYTELLAEHAAGDARAEQASKHVLDAAERATGLTRQLLTFSRKGTMELRVLDLNQVIEQHRAMLRRLIGEDIQLHVETVPLMARVKVDPSHLDQVLLNLAVNARDAMQDGGQLTIQTAEEVLTAQSPEVSEDVAPGSYVAVRVTDTGHGIASNIRDQIFDPFFTTKPQGQGTGLGLSTVYGVVRQWGGFVRVQSEVGRGTTFEVLLPISEEQHTEEPALTAPPCPSGKGVILLVEDDGPTRKLLAKMLEEAGHDVIAAGDGEEAFSLVEGRLDSVDLVISDIVMPRMGGRDLEQQLRAVAPDLQFIFMSGYPARDDTRLEEFTPTQFLAKPFPLSELRHQVQAMLQGD